MKPTPKAKPAAPTATTSGISPPCTCSSSLRSMSHSPVMGYSLSASPCCGPWRGGGGRAGRLVCVPVRHRGQTPPPYPPPRSGEGGGGVGLSPPLGFGEGAGGGVLRIPLNRG